jgi:release factor glutamine methyltransferase
VYCVGEGDTSRNDRSRQKSAEYKRICFVGHRSHQSFKSAGSDPGAAPAAPAPISATIAELRLEFRSRLESAGIETALREADWILEFATGRSRASLLADRNEAPLDPDVVQRAREAVQRREVREPLQYILGETGFYGRTFSVAPGVLIPRPETETLVERALETLAQPGKRGGPPIRVLDVGTGSGCIACAIALERPDVRVVATDVSPPALDQARANADRLGASAEFVQMDMFDAGMEGLAEPFDLILSNPPYVPDEDRGTLQPELSHEPDLALFTSGHPMRFVRRLARLGLALLGPGGRLLVELHAPDAERARETLISEGYARVQTHKDLAGNPRVLEGCPWI